MFKFMLGILIGFLLSSGVVVFGSMSGSRTDREFQKFAETSGGKTAVLITIVE